MRCYLDSKRIYPAIPLINILVLLIDFLLTAIWIDQQLICCDEKYHNVALLQNHKATFTYTQSHFLNITTNNCNMQNIYKED